MRTLLVGLGRIGMVGFGDPRVETHLNSLTCAGGFDLAAAVDPNPSARAEFQSRTGLPVYENAIDALKIEQPAVVVVASPAETHRDIVCLAASAPSVKGILCEKPMSTSVEHCTEMIEACKDKVLVIGHQRRYCNRHIKTAEFIKSGILGQISAARAFYYGDALNNGTHAADLCRMFVGDATPYSIEKVEHEFGIYVGMKHGFVNIWSKGELEPGYLRAMYGDLKDCILHPGMVPRCSGEDGREAVRVALASEEASSDRT